MDMFLLTFLIGIVGRILDAMEYGRPWIAEYPYVSSPDQSLNLNPNIENHFEGYKILIHDPVLDTSSTSKHNLYRVRGDKTWTSVRFTLPDPGDRKSIFIQFWFSSGDRSIELGLRYRRGKWNEAYRPLLFSTDDQYRTGYFGTKLVSWDVSGWSKYRLVDYYKDSYKTHYYPGEYVRITTALQGDIRRLWINGDLIGGIKNSFESVSSNFGTEVHVYDELLELNDLSIDY